MSYLYAVFVRRYLGVPITCVLCEQVRVPRAADGGCDEVIRSERYRARSLPLCLSASLPLCLSHCVSLSVEQGLAQFGFIVPTPYSIFEYM